MAKDSGMMWGKMETLLKAKATFDLLEIFRQAGSETVARMVWDSIDLHLIHDSPESKSSAQVVCAAAAIAMGERNDPTSLDLSRQITAGLIDIRFPVETVTHVTAPGRNEILPGSHTHWGRFDLWSTEE